MHICYYSLSGGRFSLFTIYLQVLRAFHILNKCRSSSSLSTNGYNRVPIVNSTLPLFYKQENLEGVEIDVILYVRGFFMGLNVILFTSSDIFGGYWGWLFTVVDEYTCMTCCHLHAHSGLLNVF